MINSTVSKGTGTGGSNWIPLDWKQAPFEVSYVVAPAGTVSFTWKLEGTLDNVLDHEVTAPTVFDLSVAAAATDTSVIDGVINQPVKAIRLNFTVHATGTATLTAMQGSR